MGTSLTSPGNPSSFKFMVQQTVSSATDTITLNNLTLAGGTGYFLVLNAKCGAAVADANYIWINNDLTSGHYVEANISYYGAVITNGAGANFFGQFANTGNDIVTFAYLFLTPQGTVLIRANTLQLSNALGAFEYDNTIVKKTAETDITRIDIIGGQALTFDVGTTVTLYKMLDI